jgi:hypothetical protein
MEGNVADKKPVKSLSFTSVKIFVFFIVGAALGSFLAYIYFGWLFGVYVENTRKYLDQDWVKVQYYSNRVVDQIIRLKKMMTTDKVKFDGSIFDAAIDTRSRIIGTDKLDEKTILIDQLEPEINDVLKYYNKRLDLKSKHFRYVEWGMLILPYIEEYNEDKAIYIAAVSSYDNMISKLPFKLVAKEKKLAVLPVPEESSITEVKTNREVFERNDNIYRMNKSEGSSSAGSY